MYLLNSFVSLNDKYIEDKKLKKQTINTLKWELCLVLFVFSYNNYYHKVDFLVKFEPLATSSLKWLIVLFTAYIVYLSAKIEGSIQTDTDYNDEKLSRELLREEYREIKLNQQEREKYYTQMQRDFIKDRSNKRKEKK